MSTPIRRQYLDLKRRHPDTILFFRLGDFYETFDDDARLIARELDIVLTSKPMGKDQRVPLAGVPHQSIEGHVARLVRAGHRVAICEQLADPAEVKGIVPRDVVRVVTAGTVTSGDALDPDRANYLAAIVRRGGELAAALADITTGEVRLVAGSAALAELVRAAPAEIIVEEPDLADGIPASARVRRSTLSELAVESILAQQFGGRAEETLVETAAEGAALAQVLAYLRETYAEALPALQRITRVDTGAHMQVDGRVLRNLDVLPETPAKPSLLKVLNATRTPMGARCLRTWLTHPSRDLDVLDARHDAVGWAAASEVTRGAVQEALKAVPDLARLTGRVAARSAGPRDLHQLWLGLAAVGKLAKVLRAQDAPESDEGAGQGSSLAGHRALTPDPSPDMSGEGRTGFKRDSRSLPALISEAAASLPAAEAPWRLIGAALADDPPAAFGSGGIIRKGFSPEIDSLQSAASDARRFLRDLERDERERTGIKSLKVGHNKVFGYYIEISNAAARALPAGYQRRQTLVNAERYVTEELKEHEANLLNAATRLQELEEAAFDRLLDELNEHLGALQEIAEAVACIDVVAGLGETAAERGYVRPRFNDTGRLLIREGRHPVVEAALGPGRFVPNDCRLDATCQIIVLTGPNMSGKSTFLRQVAVIALMAQAGSFVPAAEADLPLFDRIFSRIGAQDDLAAGQSTFMVEMQETAQILHQATPNSLVILDEVGRGTSTYDGMAIARAVLEFLHERPEAAARTLFATHYHELTDLAEMLPRVRNFRVAVSETSGDVVFEHRVEPGSVDRSYGVHVARLAGLPPQVVHRAEALLAGYERGGPRNGKRPEAMQLSFFEPVHSEIEDTITGLDLDTITPREAMQTLYDLRAKVGPRAS